MEFHNSISKSPRAFDTSLGAEVAEIFGNRPREIHDLLRGVSGSSPYLKSLIIREKDWLNNAFDQSGEVLDRVFSELSCLKAKDIAKELRKTKRRVALWVALCDLGGVWDLSKVMNTMTDFADLAVKLAFNNAFQSQIEKGAIPGINKGFDPDRLGVFVMGMGKMGAHELNYSSDIDLICFFDENRFDEDSFHRARTSFISATRKMCSILSDINDEGYVFRTDLRLRPDPAVTPICMGLEAAERYYESVGRTWERAAYIKARVVAGDYNTGSEFLQRIQPFVWRKHLDFAAIEDAYRLRSAIFDHKGYSGAVFLPGHDIKLGKGGIREIEFFTQTRQLIAGGRDKKLRTSKTLHGLDLLAKSGWITEKVAVSLENCYIAHRITEHRLQMIQDAQTHNLPKTDEGFARLAALMSTNVQSLKKDLLERINLVHELTGEFFKEPLQLMVPEKTDKKIELISRTWTGYPAFRSERAVKIFDRLQPEIFRLLNATNNPHEATLAFDSFLAGLPAGVQLFSLFEANPHLIDLLIDIVGTAPILANYLARNSGVLDAVIDGAFWNKWPGITGLEKDLASKLENLENYEQKLEETRRWCKEWHFRVGVHLLRGIIGASEAGGQYSDLAEAILRTLWPKVVAEFSKKYGFPPGRGCIILGMGSLGIKSLHSSSDLDLIIIYDARGAEKSEGKRRLDVRLYYARLAQSLVTAISAPMSEGRLYQVDMRLRPSGKQGPIATSWNYFQEYQQKEAWIWEHLALTRARVVLGASDLANEFEIFRVSLMGNRDYKKIVKAITKMRLRIAAAKSKKLTFDAKFEVGGLLDVELLAQLGRLINGGSDRDIIGGLKACKDKNIIDDVQFSSLVEAYHFFWSIRLVSKLLGKSLGDEPEIGSGATKFIMRLTGKPSLQAIYLDLKETTEEVAKIMNKVFPTKSGTNYEG